jgi:hypothetical protein
MLPQLIQRKREIGVSVAESGAVELLGGWGGAYARRSIIDQNIGVAVVSKARQCGQIEKFVSDEYRSLRRKPDQVAGLVATLCPLADANRTYETLTTAASKPAGAPVSWQKMQAPGP